MVTFFFNSTKTLFKINYVGTLSQKMVLLYTVEPPNTPLPHPLNIPAHFQVLNRFLLNNIVLRLLLLYHWFTNTFHIHQSRNWGLLTTI